MSDYIAELRDDLVEAAARHRSRGRGRRVGVRLRRRAWRPREALAAVAIAVSLVAVLVVMSTLSPSPPPGRLRVLAEVNVGGQPQDAVMADGSLWVADFEGRVVRVDPDRRRITRALEVGGQPGAIAAGPGAVWVIASETATPNVATQLVRIEARSGRILERDQIGTTTREAVSGNGLVAVDNYGVWVVPNVYTETPVLQRRDPDSGGVTARLPARRIGTEQLQAFAAGGNRVWALGEAGTIVVIDSATAEVVRRLENVASDLSLGGLPLPRQRIAPDATGAWVSNGHNLLRIEAGRVVRRVPVGTEIGPIAIGDDVLWAVATNAPSRQSRLLRINPESGEVTGTVELGRHLPAALVPHGDDAWVVTSDGTALLGGS